MLRLMHKLPALREAKLYVRNEILTWPNLFTMARFWCAIVIFARPEYHRLVFWIALGGAVTDIIDGWLAKRFTLGTDFGKKFDQRVDWLFGIALLYAIYVAGHGVRWTEWPGNGPLVLLIGGYLLIRTIFLKAETLWVAKLKTGMQFSGGVVILGGFAGIHFTFGDSASEYTISATELIDWGYLFVWCSTGVMVVSLHDYIQGWREEHK